MSACSRHISKSQISSLLAVILGLGIIAAFTFKAGAVPSGLFCDEALIATTSKKLITGEFKSLFVAPFFYHHFDYILGLLTVISVMPFVLVGPLTDFAVRYASIIYSLLSLLVLGFTLKKMRASFVIPLLLLAFSPLYFLVAHTNFGHSISFLMTCLGLYFWHSHQTNTSKKRLFLSGILIGISMYGYTSYMVGAPLIIGSLVFSELFRHKFKVQKSAPVAFLLLGFMICLVPFGYVSNTESSFFNRFEEKFGDNSTSTRVILINLAKNYPKYFGANELFLKGEQELPGGFITRHSLKSHGQYLKLYAPVLAFSLFAFIFMKDKKKWEFAPYFIMFLLMPLTDIITTNASRPPYPFALFPGLLSVPFITAYAQRVGTKMSTAIPQINQKLLVLVFVALLGFEISSLLVHFYRDYPKYSADYWGWQYGPKTIVQYFIAHQAEYDQLFMTGYFNQPQALLDFYNFNDTCFKCKIGGIDQFDSDYRQLFALRTEELTTVTQDFITKKIIALPNGNPAYSLIEIIPD